MTKNAAIFQIFAAVAVASLASAQTTSFSPAWKASWPSSDQTKPVTFNPAWQADFNTIVFSGSNAAPIVPSASVGKANANFCDWSYNLCNGTTDIIQCNAPLKWGLTFDDGPLAPQSSTLYDFLAANQVHATHFMIGTNIVQYPELVLKAFQNGNQIALHTWTHHAMTTLDSMTAYAELRYAKEIVKNITGMTPLQWRPPYGDVDNRIRTIATHLNLTTVLWNKDTNDWCIGDANPAADGCGAFTPDSVHTNLEAWSVNQKANPGGLVVLEHELSNGSVAQFMEAFPTMKANGWNIMPVATCNNVPFYAESANGTNTTVSSSVPVSSAPATASGASNNTLSVNPGGASVTGAPAATAKSSAASFHYGAASAMVVLVAAVSQLL